MQTSPVRASAHACTSTQACASDLPPTPPPDEDEYDQDEPEPIGEPPMPIPVPPAPERPPMQLS